MAQEFAVVGAMTLTGGRGRLDDEAFTGRQLRLVIAMLLLERHEPIATTWIAGQLWPDRPPIQWQAGVRNLVSTARRLLADVGVDDDVIHHRAGHDVVDLPELQVDVEQVATNLRVARNALAAGRVAQAKALAGAARAVAHSVSTSPG